MQRNKDGEQKLFNQFGLFSLLIIFTATTLFAESFSDFKSVQHESFNHYKDQKDNEFNKYLKDQWREYQAYITPSFYKEEKPKEITPLRKKKSFDVGPVVKVNIPQREKIKTKIKTISGEVPKGTTIDFFGRVLSFNKDPKITSAQFYPQSQAGIANFFSILASSNYNTTLDEIYEYQKMMRLNDWGVYLLINKLAQATYGDKNEANIYAWFLFNKLSYDVKIALNENKNIYLLHYSKIRVYSKPRYTFHSKYYYILASYNKSEISKIYTYTQEYPNANKALDFSLDEIPLLAEHMSKKVLSFEEFATKYEIAFRYNKEIIAFMKTYPQVDYSVYFKAPMEEVTYQDLLVDLKKYIDGKKMSQALNFVLHFVQKAFKYERDQEQFGFEKVMFAEETLVYDASDCEDRAVLFSYLVEHIFGISALGIKYSDHMSTALYIPMKGDDIIYKRRRYVLADPTYINANIGQEIAKYRDIEPDSFIKLSKYK